MAEGVAEVFLVVHEELYKEELANQEIVSKIKIIIKIKIVRTFDGK